MEKAMGRAVVGKVGLGLAIAAWSVAAAALVLRSGFRSPIWHVLIIVFLLGCVASVVGIVADERKGYAVAGLVVSGIAAGLVGLMAFVMMCLIQFRQ